MEEINYRRFVAPGLKEARKDEVLARGLLEHPLGPSVLEAIRRTVALDFSPRSSRQTGLPSPLSPLRKRARRWCTLSIAALRPSA
jgi:hypothetical protein